MTKQKTFKSRVRTRMAKTSESYTAARRVLIANRAPAGSEGSEFTPVVPDETVSKVTGHNLQHWFSLLDAWDATKHSHGEIARWLVAQHGVTNWWSQSITVAYERGPARRRPAGRRVLRDERLEDNRHPRGAPLRSVRKRKAARTVAAWREVEATYSQSPQVSPL